MNGPATEDFLIGLCAGLVIGAITATAAIWLWAFYSWHH